MNISDDYLLRAHRNAVTLKLDRNFICILEKEIKRRNLLLYR
ncbi:sporulation histidine kinase inhibitor Sda [Domibacillus mangrovi]|nr:sporulation histidine kinase inhibitor Sda [Domibacillus mangrovi]